MFGLNIRNDILFKLKVELSSFVLYVRQKYLMKNKRRFRQCVRARYKKVIIVAKEKSVEYFLLKQMEDKRKSKR